MRCLAKQASADHPTWSPRRSAFSDPTKIRRSILLTSASSGSHERWGWQIAPGRTVGGRVVPSPEPKEIVELAAIACGSATAPWWCVPVGAGYGHEHKDGTLRGVEAVIDKDLTAALLAKGPQCGPLAPAHRVTALEADTDGSGPTDSSHNATRLAKMALPAGSMGQKPRPRASS